MGMSITIRKLRAGDDLDAVVSLCKEFFAEYQAHHDDLFDTNELSDDDVSERFRQSIESESSVTFVAVGDGAVVGYLAADVREQPPFYKIRQVGSVWGLIVARTHRRMGIGSRLLAEARAYFRRKGIRYFTVYTATSNTAAVECYRRNGMTPLYTTFVGEAAGEGAGRT